MPKVTDEGMLGEPRRLVGYRLKRGFVLFTGFRQTPFLKGAVVGLDDPVLSRLFAGGADLEPVME